MPALEILYRRLLTVSSLKYETTHAITKGEAAASLTNKFKPGSLDGTKRPMIVVPPI
jgi:hypothetical protein